MDKYGDEIVGLRGTECGESARIALWGGSAGGHLVSLAGTSAHTKELEDLSMGNADYSCQVQAVVDWFGPTNFLTMDESRILPFTGYVFRGRTKFPCYTGPPILA